MHLISSGGGGGSSLGGGFLLFLLALANSALLLGVALLVLGDTRPLPVSASPLDRFRGRTSAKARGAAVLEETAASAAGAVSADYACGAAVGDGLGPSVEDEAAAAAATAHLRSSLAHAYLNDTTLCEALGPVCVAEGGHLVLYRSSVQPVNNTYTPLEGSALPVLAALRRVMHLVTWGEGGNADVWNGNIRVFDREVLRLWPAGPAAPPPVPFSSCVHPVALFWDFPENFWHTMAVYSGLWAAAAGGALPPDATLALGLPFGAASVAQYLTEPLLRVVTRGAVTTLSHLGAQGQPEEAAAAGGAPPALRLRCFQRITMCSLAGFHELPPRTMFPFMQALKGSLLGGGDMSGGAGAAAAPLAWPPGGVRWVTSAEGALRITFALRAEGTRRVLNAAELLSDCNAAGALLLKGPAGEVRVPLVCTQRAFGGEGGMAADAAAMDATDVLVGVHGAGLTNLGFLRPGALVLELRPLGFDRANADRFYRPLARDSGCLKWWGLLLHDKFQTQGAAGAAKRGNPSKWERDKDLLVPWEGVAAALVSAAEMSFEEWQIKEPKAISHIM